MTRNDRTYLQQVDERYLGLLSFESEAEKRALDAAGFPTAEEWLSARQLSDDELQRLAEADREKARVFYADRKLSRFEAATIKSAGGPKTDELETELVLASAGAHASALMALRQSRTPFSAYLAGVSEAATGGTMEPLAAGIQLAGDLGDRRAGKVLKQFNQQHPGANVSLIHSSYTTMRTFAGLDR